MRNEHASIPYLAGIAELIPRTLTADFTHQLIGREHLFQTHLDGVQASVTLGRHPARAAARSGTIWGRSWRACTRSAASASVGWRDQPTRPGARWSAVP